MGASGAKARGILVVLLFAALSIVSFSPVMRASFDPQIFLSVLDPLRARMSVGKYLIESWSLMQNGGRSGFFRPLTSLTFLVDYNLWGSHAAGYRALNVALHVACCACVAALARAFGAGRAGSLAAGMLFAVHPGAQNAVSLLATRGDLLATLFLLLSLLASVRVLGGEGPMSIRRLLPAFAFGILALGSKELGMAFLAAVPLLFMLYPDRRPGTSIITPILGTAVLAAAYLGMRLAVLGGLGGYSQITPPAMMPGNLLTVVLQASGSWFIGSGLLRKAWLCAAGAMILGYALPDHARRRKIAALSAILVLFSFQAVVGVPCAHYAYAPASIFCVMLGLTASNPVSGGRRWPSVASAVILFLAVPAGIGLSWVQGRIFDEENRPIKAVFEAVEDAAPAFEPDATYWILIQPGGPPEQIEMKNIRLYMAWFRPGERFHFEFSADSAGVPGGRLVVWEDGRIAFH